MKSPIYALELRMAHDAIIRLYLASTGRYTDAYHDDSAWDPETDEGLVIGIIERARNEWRIQSRRRRRELQLATTSVQRTDGDDVPDTER